MDIWKYNCTFLFKFSVPSQQAALQQVSLMKRELTELRTELSLRERDMYKDENELQTEVSFLITSCVFDYVICGNLILSGLKVKAFQVKSFL